MNEQTFNQINAEKLADIMGAEYTYELSLPTDEDIQSVATAEGITDVNLEEVRSYIKESLYKLFCEAANKNKV